MKASDRQELANTLAPILGEEFGPAPPEADRPVLETLIYSVLLEDLPAARAEAAYDALTGGFSDWNDVRVSTISEIVAVLKGLPRPELRAHRIRTVLQTVFEDRYEFTLEPVRKKSLEAAAKALDKIRDLSAFSRQYTLQHALRGHAVPVDGTTGRAAVWLGLAEGDAATDAVDETAIAESLKQAIRKADAAEFNHLLRAFATDERFAPHFGKKWAIPEGGYDPADAPARLKAALADPKSALPPASAKSRLKPAPKPAAPAPDAEGSAPDDGRPAAKPEAKKKPAAKKSAPKGKPAAAESAANKPPAKSAAKSPAKTTAKTTAKSGAKAAKSSAKAPAKTNS